MKKLNQNQILFLNDELDGELIAEVKAKAKLKIAYEPDNDEYFPYIIYNGDIDLEHITKDLYDKVIIIK